MKTAAVKPVDCETHRHHRGIAPAIVGKAITFAAAVVDVVYWDFFLVKDSNENVRNQHVPPRRSFTRLPRVLVFVFT